ncbi:hypothetical protein ARALYDRAFT_320270 [Arabidopsis lyrata subsp. lyrata]|uniref:Uncharacterized protein n=1 Tax=Arabidopsis lyrata subsp. lyrata TaxID=81972 RepID=D7LIA4_ARALL|nr:hypothetical protein ARALYDRAFT_320270 [Arabidopsis lyrata subsp. lyrata]
MIPAPQISSQVSDSRRILLLSWQSKVKLGFSPVDLFSNFGPIPPRRPKPISWFKNLKANILRSVFIILMLSPSHYLCRSPLLHGRGLYVREVSPLLPWLCIYSIRILVLVVFRDLWYAYKGLKNYDLIISNRFCRSVNCGIGLVWFSVQISPSSSYVVFKHLNLTTISIIQILCYKVHVAIYRRDLNLLLWVSKLSSTDYRTIVSRILVIALPWVLQLTPMRNVTLIHSATSQRLLTMTNLSSFESLEDDHSIHRDLTCLNVLPSPCLKAFMNLKSMNLIYLFIALGNAFCCNVLNFGFLEILLFVNV